jgi:hypothetical protein
MTAQGEPTLFAGTALDGAVQVWLDEHGLVRSVRLDSQVIRRLWPEQLGQGLVAAHAEARAAARNGRSGT